jgi:hypothetical protein
MRDKGLGMNEVTIPLTLGELLNHFQIFKSSNSQILLT